MLRRSLAQSYLLTKRPSAVLGPVGLVRCYGWNPFLKRTARVEKEEELPSSTKEVVSRVKQDLRKNTSFNELNSLLMELVESSPNKDSFILMNEILRRLEQTQFKKSKTPVAVQLPPISTNDAYLLYRTVIDHIDTENFKLARFIPRLYLQLTQAAATSKNDRLLIQVFHNFIKYLTVLGQEEQTSKIVESFVKEHKSLGPSAMDSVVLVLNGYHPTPTLTLNLLEIFTKAGLNYDQLKKLHSLVVKSIDSFISGRNKLYAIDPNNLHSIKKYISDSTERSNTPEDIVYLLQICADSGGVLQEEEHKILSKTVQFLLNNRSYICKDENSLKTYIRALVNNTSLSYEERKIAGNMLIDSFKKNSKSKLTKGLFDVYVQWQVFVPGKLDTNSKEYLLEHKDSVDDFTYSSTVASVAYSNSQDIDTQVSDMFEFFEVNFEDLDRTLETYSILMERGIKRNDLKYTKEIFEKSLNDGVSWISNPNALYRFFNLLATEEGADVFEVFQWYKKVKVFLKYLDSKSYNSLMKLFLQKELIGDAITSLEKELPPLEKDTKYSVSQYPDLFNTMYQWILNFNGDPEVSWALYGELQKYFHVPYDAYFPLMKKFVSLKRPDAAFMIFQKIKKLHRTTGSIPPPTPEMYSYLFQVFGEDLYEEGVKNLHIIMKMDLQLNTDINVMNALLGSYCNLQEYFRTQEIFDQIISMPKDKGVNNETMTIMLKCYTYVSLSHVKSFWDNMYEYDIIPNEENFKQYIIAHCYHEQYDSALQIASNMKDFDLLVTPEIIESLYNWTEGEDKKQKVEDWASKNHKLMWNNIKKQKLKSKEDFDNVTSQETLETKLIHESAV